MKTVIVNEINQKSQRNQAEGLTFDLTERCVKDCIGCWTCWWKTPGRCIHKDIDDFYQEYISAEKVVFFSKVKKGFVSGNLKTLFDRMIPLYLPYISYATGESMHVPRYEKYPDIEFYYEGEFENTNSRQIFENYVHRVFYQFHSNKISIKPIEEFNPQREERL